MVKTLEKPIASKGSASANAITERKLTLPTMLKATPKANTATAISNITPIPSLKALCDFLSLPIFSTSDVLESLDLELPIFMIVCWLAKISLVSFCNAFTPTLISLISLIKSPPCKAFVVAELDSPLLASACAISPRATDKLFKASSNFLSIYLM